MNHILKCGLTLGFILMIGLLAITPLPRAAHSQNPTPQRIESDDASVMRAGNWTSQAASQASGSSYLYSSGADDDMLTLQFSGPSIEVIFVAGPSLGTLAMNVDDTVLRTVMTTAEQTAYQQSSRIDYLSDEPHTLKVYAQAGGVVTVDAFVVPTPSPTPPLSGEGDYSPQNEGDTQAEGHKRLPCTTTSGGRMTQASVDNAGNGGSNSSHFPVMSASGRYVAFISWSALVPEDTNQDPDTYLYDLETCTVERVSLTSNEQQSYGSSGFAVGVTADGRYVAFDTNARLAPEDTNTGMDSYIRDRVLGTTTIIQYTPLGGPTYGVRLDDISTDGRYLLFFSGTGNLYVHDRQEDSTILASVSNSGTLANDPVMYGTLTDNGRYVAFYTYTALVPADTNNTYDIYLRDLQANTTSRISVATDGTQGDDHSTRATISESGNVVVFLSGASNLVPDDTNAVTDIFLRDLTTNTTSRISVSRTGQQSYGNKLVGDVSTDGRYVVFSAEEGHLDPDSNASASQIYWLDRQTGELELISRHTNGLEGVEQAVPASVSDDGRFVAFGSSAQLVMNTSADEDVFVYDRQGLFHPLYTGIGTIYTTSIDLSWYYANTDETEIRVERSTSANGPWLEVAAVPIVDNIYADQRYTDTNLFTSTTYYYRSRVYRERDNAFSPYTPVRGPLTTLPFSPTLTVTRLSRTQARLNWLDSPDETEYRIERRSSPLMSWEEIAVVPSNTTSFIDQGLECDLSYGYRVRGYRASDATYSSYSNVATTTTQICSPVAPSNLTVATLSQVSIRLTWTDNASDETNFGIERSPNGTSGWSQIGSTVTNVASFTDTVYLACGTTYYYRVRSYRSGDGVFSTYSNITSAATSACRPDALALVNPATRSANLVRTLTNPPAGGDYIQFATGLPYGPGGQYVMGDWNGDGLDTIGVYREGAFFFTNDYGTWGGIWFGLGGQAVVGRFDANVNHDCLGVTDSGTWTNGDTYFALYFTCNLTSGPTPPLTFQWLSILLPTSQGFTGTFQFVAGDFNGDGVDSVAVRRGAFIAWTNIPPTTVQSQFNLAQYIGTPGAGDEGKVVSGDWDLNNVDSFGLVYQNGTFYRRNDVEWNTGVYILQQFTPLVGTPFDVASWRPN